MLISGGWDNTLLFYDIRSKEVNNYLYGAHICGDGMDIKDSLRILMFFKLMLIVVMIIILIILILAFYILVNLIKKILLFVFVEVIRIYLNIWL